MKTLHINAHTGNGQNFKAKITKKFIYVQQYQTNGWQNTDNYVKRIPIAQVPFSKMKWLVDNVDIADAHEVSRVLAGIYFNNGGGIAENPGTI